MSIGVAIIGSGIFATTAHLPGVLDSPSLTLKAVYSRSLASASALTADLSQKVDWYSDETADQGRGYDDLLTNTNIKAVIIALPIPVQPEFIKKALAAGKHVLSEKPIAPDVDTAKELLGWYRSNVDTTKVTFSVAENWRFADTHTYAAEEVRRLGKVTNFRVRKGMRVPLQWEYYNTPWRKDPKHQGGFLLDTGVHDVAAMRLFLGPENAIKRVVAFSNQVLDYVKPIDTISGAMQTVSGLSGTFAVSCGTYDKGIKMVIACEGGSVAITHNKVTTTPADQDPIVREFSDDKARYGVKQEMDAWVACLESGTQDPRLLPEEALKDLEIVEAMLHSGASDGKPVDLLLQA